MGRGQLPIRIGLGVGVLVALFWLVWIDVLPGGWTLRGWVEPHALTEQRARELHANRRLTQFQAQRDLALPGSILFAGSSTIERFPLATCFPGAPTLNRGINDEPCAQLALRWEASLPSAPIGGAVLYLGSVDFRRLQAAPEVIADRAAKILGKLRADDPKIPVLVIGILPEQTMPASWAERLEVTNRLLREVCSLHGADFLDTNRAPLQTTRGDLDPDYATDRWHLNPRGYDVLVRWWLADFPEWKERLAPR